MSHMETDSIMHEWVTAYPNVSQLPVSDSNMYYRGHRERNLRALADQCWSGLDTCDARHVVDLYALGLPCRIRAVKFFEELKFRSLQLFPETMAYARPVVLYLSLYTTYLATFQTTVIQAASDLRDLEQRRLTIRFEGESVDKDLPRSLPTLFSWKASTRSECSPNSECSHFECRVMQSVEIFGLNINEMPQGTSPIDEQVQRTDVIDA
ncbi:hypothetical protein C8Q74DRAFT_1222620 [Fomes fomentarius]|nr:hypothetical protein C8Q74DRAFT_1222620 [Fomes fomentarius]